jgi:hypothetical protein
MEEPTFMDSLKESRKLRNVRWSIPQDISSGVYVRPQVWIPSPKSCCEIIIGQDREPKDAGPSEGGGKGYLLPGGNARL